MEVDISEPETNFTKKIEIKKKKCDFDDYFDLTYFKEKDIE